MDGISPDDILKRERFFRDLLRNIPVNVKTTFDPKDFIEGSKKEIRSHAMKIVNKDLKIMRMADLLLVDLSKRGHVYIGSICEIVYAYFMKIPVVVYVGNAGLERRTWLLYHADRICTDVDSVERAVCQIIGFD